MGRYTDLVESSLLEAKKQVGKQLFDIVKKTPVDKLAAAIDGYVGKLYDNDEDDQLDDDAIDYVFKNFKSISKKEKELGQRLEQFLEGLSSFMQIDDRHPKKFDLLKILNAWVLSDDEDEDE